MNALGIVVISVLGVIFAFVLYRMIVDIIWNKRLEKFHKTNENPVFKSPLRMLNLKRGMIGASTALIALVLVVTGVFDLPQTVLDVDTGKLKTLEYAKKAHSMEDILDKMNADDASYYYPPVAGNDALAPEEDLDGTTASQKSIVGTNNHVEGVEESDTVKTDGDLIVFADQYNPDTLQLFEVDENGLLTKLAPIIFDKYYISSIFLTEDYIITIGMEFENMYTYYDQDHGIYSMAYVGWFPTLYQGKANVVSRDTHDIVYSIKTNGLIKAERLIDNNLYLIFNTYRQEASILPKFIEIKDDVEVESVLPFEDIFFFDQIPAYNLTTILSLNLNTFEYDAEAYLGVAEDIYVTKTAIYVSGYYYQEGIFFFDGGNKTHLVKFKLNTETGKVSYAASIVLSGYIQNQFFMDEYQGHLRVATSIQWDAFDKNRLYVLEEDETTDKFYIVGLLQDGIGKPQERIMSVRFFENLAYIVTFRNTDPLYTIDLSDPANPVIINEIEEPGFSTYLHRFGDQQLIGIGYDETFGVKISAYLTENTSLPLETYYFKDDGPEYSWSYSQALNDHTKILVSPDLGFIGFAVSKTTYGNNQNTYSSAFYVFNIDFEDEDIIKDPIIINHTGALYTYTVDKAVYIDGIFYTFSNLSVVSYNVSTSSIMQTVDLKS